MMDEVSARKKSNCFICFGIGNLSNLAVIKSLCKFGGQVVDNNTFFV